MKKRYVSRANLISLIVTLLMYQNLYSQHYKKIISNNNKWQFLYSDTNSNYLFLYNQPDKYDYYSETLLKKYAIHDSLHHDILFFSDSFLVLRYYDYKDEKENKMKRQKIVFNNSCIFKVVTIDKKKYLSFFLHGNIIGLYKLLGVFYQYDSINKKLQPQVLIKLKRVVSLPTR